MFNSTTQSQFLTTLKKKSFENIVGKGENAGYQHFLLFPQCFLPFPQQILIFGHIYFVVCKFLQFGPCSPIFCRLVKSLIPVEDLSSNLSGNGLENWCLVGKWLDRYWVESHVKRYFNGHKFTGI